MYSNKTVFHKMEDYKYTLTVYTVTDKGIVLVEEAFKNFENKPTSELYIQFVRGSKVQDENKVDALDGVLPEQLISACADHFKNINTGELFNTDTMLAIEHLEDALLRLYAREYKRSKRGALGTYQK